jgi:quercetin dioxygenase-like cupin family protein
MRVLTRGLALAAALGAASAFADAAADSNAAPPHVAAQTEPVVHMSKEPRHEVVFESGTTRVQDVQIPPGDTTLFHTHDHAVLYVPIGSSRTRSQVLGEAWSGGGTAPGRGRDSSGAAGATPGRLSSNPNYVEKPVTHRVNNIGDSLFRLIAVGNLSTGADGNTDDVSGLGAKPEVLNKYYRAYRVSLAAGQSTAAHRHAWPVVVVQQTAGQLTIEGSESATTTEPGKFAFHDGSSMHQVKNTGTSAVEMIEVELRGGSAKP